MAIATLSTVNDGLQPKQKERGHCVVDVNLEDSEPWIPYAEGVWVQLCRFYVTTGGFTVVLRVCPRRNLGSITTLACAWFYATWSLEVSRA